MEKTTNKIGFVEGVEVDNTIKLLTDTVNSLIDNVNYLMNVRIIEYKNTETYIERVKKYEQLIKDGVDVDSLSYRVLGEKMGIRGAQSVKDFVAKYKFNKLKQ